MSCPHLGINELRSLIKKYQKTIINDFAIIKKDCGDLDICVLKTAKENNYNIIEEVKIT